MKTTTLCAVAFLFAVTSSAFAVSVDRDITADYVKANPKEFTVSVSEKANGLLAFTVVFTTPDPRYVVAHLVVRDAEKIYATSDTPSFTKNRPNKFHFSIPRDLVATSTFSLGVSGFADSGDEAAPLPGTITNKLQLLAFVPEKAAGIKGATFHLNSGEDFLVDKETVIAKLANVVQSGEEKLQGEWRVTGMRVKGQDVKVAELGDGVYLFAKNQLKVTGTAKSVAEMTLRPDSEPKELDLKAIEGVGAGKTAYGLYRFEGEKLVLCIGDVRPSTFSGDDDAGLLILERFVAVGAGRAANEDAASTLNAAVEKFNEETRFVALTNEKSDHQSNLDTIKDHKLRQGIESKTLIERGQDHADAVDVGPVRRFVDLTNPLLAQSAVLTNPLLAQSAVLTNPLLAQSAVPNAHPKALPTDTDVAAPAKPFRYNVVLVLREYADGESYGMTSLSLPIVTEDVPATIELKTGTIVVSARATVTRPEKTAMATINVTFSRDGKQIASPDVAITIGHRGVVRVGDKVGISLEAILVGE